MHVPSLSSLLIIYCAVIVQSSKPAYHATRQWQRSASTSGLLLDLSIDN